jgi:DNA repair protein RecO (recombination protein O)
MQLVTPATIVSVRAHGEHGAIVRSLTPGDGIRAGYVRGGKSRRLRPALVPGNRIEAQFRQRTQDQLAQLTLELIHSRAFLMSEPVAAAGMAWACALCASLLPEEQPYPHIHDALEGLLGAIEASPAARGWAGALARFELILLGELGFGLERERIGRYPALRGVAGSWDDILAALAVTGERLERDLLGERRNELLAGRERLIDQFRRVVA